MRLGLFVSCCLTAETAALKASAEATKKELVRVAKDGTLGFNRTLQPWTLVLIREL